MQHYIIDDWNTFCELDEYVRAHSFSMVALDIETDSVVEIQARTFGVGLAFQDDEAFYIPLRNKYGDIMWSDLELKSIINWVFLRCKERRLIGHNIIYDVLVLKHEYKIDLIPHIYSDTILMKHMVDEEMPFGLKEVAVKYLGPWADMAQKEMMDSVVKNGGSITKTNFQMFKADTEVLGKYCAWDVMLTYKLFNLFQPQLEKENLMKLFYEDEVMPLYREVTIPMKERGVKIDVGHFEKMKTKINTKITDLEDRIYSTIRPLIAPFEDNFLNEEFPVKKTGNFPKEVAAYLGLDIQSLAKKSVEKLEVTTDFQSNFKDWLLSDIIELGVDARTIQLRMFRNKYPDRRHVFNFKSKDHLKHLFFEVLGESPISETDGGEPRVDDELLASLASKYDWVDLLRDLNVCHKMLGTYVEGLLERVVNGRLHTSFLQFGTTSGRYASRNVNLQNWPAHQKTDTKGLNELQSKHKLEMDEIVNSIRYGLTASTSFKMIGIDYNSLEPHIAAYVSNDKDLMDIFIKGLDFYSAIAIKQFNLGDKYSADKKTDNYLGSLDKKLRDSTKTYSLAVFYGATAPRISQVLSCSKEEAQELLDGYLDAFPGIRNFIESTHNQVNTIGYVQTKFGRRRHLPEVKYLFNRYGKELSDYVWAKRRNVLEERSKYRNLINNSVNFQIQGMAAHAINRASLKIVRELKRLDIEAYIVSSVHDELIIEAPENIINKVAEIAKHCMETSIDISPIKLKAQPIIGNSYGECK